MPAEFYGRKGARKGGDVGETRKKPPEALTRLEESLVRVLTEPVTWIVTINALDLELTTEELMDQRLFRKKAIEKLKAAKQNVARLEKTAQGNAQAAAEGDPAPQDAEPIALNGVLARDLDGDRSRALAGALAVACQYRADMPVRSARSETR